MSAIKTTNTQISHIATFAGGCFWCMIPPFQKLQGVFSVIAGYTGGSMENPTYEKVCAGKTGHYEAVQISYDPLLISYEELLLVFWRQINPIDSSGQFLDRGEQYSTAIFYHTKEQQRLAEEAKEALNNDERFYRIVATKILPYKSFYPAEEYHQDFHRKNPEHYTRYKKGSGR